MILRRRSVTAALVSVALLSGCREPTAPDATEPLVVAVSHRLLTQEDQLPSVRVTAGPGQVSIAIARPSLCATLVEAHVARASRDLALVTRVAGNPGALCTAIPAVVDYGVTIQNVAARSWTVRVFEAVGDGKPRFLRQAHVRVLPGDA